MPSPLRIFFAIVLVVLWCSPARCGTPAGSVVAISGRCFVESEGKRSTLKLGDAVSVADTLDVPAGAKLKLRMNDGSILSVAVSSRMTIAAYTIDADGKRHDVELSLGQGLMRAVVAPLDRPARFEVKTATAAAGVRSTDWFIEASPGATTAAVLVGSVALTGNATGASVEIPARSGSSVETGRDPAPPRRWRQAEFNALITRTEPARPRAMRRAAPAGDDSATATGPPSDYGAQPYSSSGPPPGSYGPGPYHPGPGGSGPPSGGYSPYPGGFPGGYPGGYGRTPGGTPSRGSHPN